MVAKSQYICSLQVDTNWYWDQHPQQHVITFTTRAILHPKLEVNEIVDIHDIPKIVYKTHIRKKTTSRHPIYWS